MTAKVPGTQEANEPSDTETLKVIARPVIPAQHERSFEVAAASEEEIAAGAERRRIRILGWF